MKKVIIALLVVIVLIFSTYFFYFKSTPQYSVLQLAKAYKNHNLELAQKYIDIEGLSQQISDAGIELIRQELEKPSTQPQNEWEKLGWDAVTSLFKGTLPSMGQKLKDEIKQAIIDSVEGKPQEKSNIPKFQTISIRDLLPGGKVKIVSEGAIRRLSIPNEKGELLAFRMRKEDSRWKIVKWENIDEIAKKLAEEARREEAKSKTKEAKFGERVKIWENINWFLTVSAPTTYTPKGGYDYPSEGNKFVVIDVLHENLSDEQGSYDPANFELKDKKDYRYKRKYNGKEPVMEFNTLPAGQKARGLITYEVPEDAEISEVLYSNLSGVTIIFKE